ncbi:MAG: YggS family pyridoxal phosphate-dependent enzyme [Acidobacteria bacterium]|nr:YggS family pyridoxal phosphate-dependent enzyme [Acidobacteriota bacterium]
MSGAALHASIAARLAQVHARIAAACVRAGRDPASVTLVGVTKTVGVPAIQAALEAGLQVLGENRVQEALPKLDALPRARWHFIGELQRNKARRVAERFELIHSVDSLRLGETLARIGDELGRPVAALVEVNVGGEASKAGIEPEELEPLLRALAGRPGLALRGLMAVPPPVDDPDEARPFFRRLAGLARAAAALGLPGVAMHELSMGMTHDFEVAIEEGATFVRVGTGIFGARSAAP